MYIKQYHVWVIYTETISKPWNSSTRNFQEKKSVDPWEILIPTSPVQVDFTNHVIKNDKLLHVSKVQKRLKYVKTSYHTSSLYTSMVQTKLQFCFKWTKYKHITITWELILERYSKEINVKLPRAIRSPQEWRHQKEERMKRNCITQFKDHTQKNMESHWTEVRLLCW